MQNSLLIEIQYWPCISWFLLVAGYETVVLDAAEHYRKASYRNRCHLLGPNGLQRLSIPLQKGKNQHTPMRNVRTAGDVAWQKNHWMTITSCYRRSAYFEYYEDALYPFYHNPAELLFPFNLSIIRWVMETAGMQKEFILADAYIEPGTPGYDDYRDRISPHSEHPPGIQLPEYNQVFSDRFAFHPNLSILDWICNAGKIKLSNI